jgi:hypothetical protein
MTPRMKRAAFALVALLAAAPQTGSAAPLDELDRFAGTWQSQGTFVESPYHAAGNATATTTCAWSVDGAFMICQQSISMNDTHDNELGIYSYDTTTASYRFYAVRPSQTTSETITIAGNTITYPFSFEENGKAVTIRTVNVWQSADLYNWRTEYSVDGGATWTLMASGTTQRR